ncbi:MAG: hypothetical protein GY856_05210, partial [bacterium]|nr:hypothetical protein [bacterium]
MRSASSAGEPAPRLSIVPPHSRGYARAATLAAPHSAPAIGDRIAVVSSLVTTPPRVT